MNASVFEVRTTARFDRLLRKLASGHPQEASKIFAQAIALLKVDPYTTVAIGTRLKNWKASLPVKANIALSSADGASAMTFGVISSRSS